MSEVNCKRCGKIREQALICSSCESRQRSDIERQERYLENDVITCNALRDEVKRLEGELSEAQVTTKKLSTLADEFIWLETHEKAQAMREKAELWDEFLKQAPQWDAGELIRDDVLAAVRAAKGDKA